jgi:hypothetical protein
MERCADADLVHDGWDVVRCILPASSNALQLKAKSTHKPCDAWANGVHRKKIVTSRQCALVISFVEICLQERQPCSGGKHRHFLKSKQNGQFWEVTSCAHNIVMLLLAAYTNQLASC